MVPTTSAMVPNRPLGSKCAQGAVCDGPSVSADVALEWVTQLGHDLQDKDYPIEAQSLGRTLIRWRHLIAAWHLASHQQRTHRGGQQLDQAGQAGGVWVHVVLELQSAVTALRRQTQLVSARHDHTPVKSEAP